MTVTTQTFGNAGLSAAPGSPQYPNAAAFSPLSGASHFIPSLLISLHRPKNAPLVSRSATGHSCSDEQPPAGGAPSSLSDRRLWIDLIGG